MENKRQLIDTLYERHQGKPNYRRAIQEDYFLTTGDELPIGTLKHHIKRIKKAGKRPPVAEMGGFADQRFNSDGSITSQIRKRLTQKKVFSNEELLELHTINTKENEIKQIVSNEWTMTNKDGETFYNFQSKIIAVPLKEGGLTFEDFRELVREEPIKFDVPLVGVGTRNLVVGMADIHLGVTTIEMILNEIAEIMEIAENGYDTIVIEQLGDYFHSSQMKQSITLKGTILQTVDMAKAWNDGKSLMIRLIDHFLKHCNKVQIETAMGNHSGNLEYVLLDFIKERYSLLENERVVVNNHLDWRTAYKVGNVGIMLAHGDNTPPQKLVGKFAAEYPQLWGSVEHREVHTGHRHSKFKEIDENGIVIRQFPTKKPTDDYEDEKGYISRKLIEVIEYDEDRSKVIYEI